MKSRKKPIVIAVLVSIFLCGFVFFAIVRFESIGIDFGSTHLDLPFGIDDVKNVEMYHYIGASATAEKKTLADKESIQHIYESLKSSPLKKKRMNRDPSKAKVTSFRFNLSNNTDYEIVYAEYGVKDGTLSSKSDGIEYFTISNIGWHWEFLDGEIAVVPADGNELPK